MTGVGVRLRSGVDNEIVAGGVVYALASLALGTVSISRIKGMMAELGRSQITVPQLDEASQE